jgi:glycosyltransferase involved in cell wall biosynthesis
MKPDVVHCCELESLVFVFLTTRLTGKHPLIVYDAHEYFPSLITEYIRLPKPAAMAWEQLLNALELSFASRCNAIITVNSDLASKFSVFHKPLVILRNFSELSWFDNARVVEVLEDVNSPIVVSTAIDTSRGLQEILEAKTLLDNAGVKVCIVLAGRMPRKGVHTWSDIKEALSRPTEGLRVMGWVEYDLLPSLLRRASIGLVIYSPAAVSNKRKYRAGESNKLFDYMIAGLPMIVTDLPALRALVTRNKCGLLVKAADADAIARAIAELLGDGNARSLMSKEGRQAAEREYNWETESARLISLYETFETNQYRSSSREVSHEITD